MKNILHIDSSGQGASNSVSRKLSRSIVETISGDNDSVVYRDVSQGLPFVDEIMIGAYYTPKEDRTSEQNQAIAISDGIVEEIANSDVLVLGAPMYNFSAPSGLKAWADLVARVGETFRYTENGPVGLLEGKKAYVVVATGGVPVDSNMDFLTPWVRFFLGFLGISDVDVISAEAMNSNAEEAIRKAEESIEMLAV